MQNAAKLVMIGLIALSLIQFVIGISHPIPPEHQINELTGRVDATPQKITQHQLGVIKRIFESADGMSVEVDDGTIITGVQSGSILQANKNATLRIVHSEHLDINSGKNMFTFGHGSNNDYRLVYAKRFLCQEQFNNNHCYQIGKHSILIQRVMISSAKKLNFEN